MRGLAHFTETENQIENASPRKVNKSQVQKTELSNARLHEKMSIFARPKYIRQK